MVVTGTVVDVANDQPLPGASVMIVDQDANPLGPGDDADDNGQFYSESSLLPNNYLLFSNVGYMSVLAPSKLFAAYDYPEVALAVVGQNLPDVIIRPPGKKENTWMLWAGGLLIVLLVAGDEHRKKKGRISGPEWQNLAIKVGIGVAAYFLIVRPILIKLGILEGKDEKKVKEDRAKAIEDAAAAQYKKQSPTFTDAVLSSFADSLFESMRYSWLDDDYDVTEEVLKKAQNLSDVYKMIQFFGTRQECLFGVICTNLTLPEMVKRNLSSSRINNVNSYYESKSIDYRW